MAAVGSAPGPRFGRLAVAGAAIIGFLAGSTGLAMAGALPDPAQDVAHDVLGAVQIDVPEGKRGPCVSAIAKSDLTKDEKKAAKAACPKGGSGKSGEAPGESGDLPHSDDPCRGRPPWAGNKGLTADQKDALKAERRTLCGPDDDDLDDDELDDDDEVDEVDEDELDDDVDEAEKSEPETTPLDDDRDDTDGNDETDDDETGGDDGLDDDETDDDEVDEEDGSETDPAKVDKVKRS